MSCLRCSPLPRKQMPCRLVYWDSSKLCLLSPSSSVGHCCLCLCFGRRGESRGRSGSEPDTLPEVGQVVFNGRAGLGLSDSQTQKKSPGHQEQHAVQPSGGLVEHSAKEQGGTSHPWVDVGRLAACGDEVPRGLAAPQVWSNVSALETGWALIEPQHPRSLRVSPCGPSSTRSAPTRGRRLPGETRSSLQKVAPGQGTLPGTPGGTRGPRGCRQQRQALRLVGWQGGAAL